MTFTRYPLSLCIPKGMGAIKGPRPSILSRPTLAPRPQWCQGTLEDSQARALPHPRRSTRDRFRARAAKTVRSTNLPCRSPKSVE